MKNLIFKCSSTSIRWAIILLTTVVYSQNTPTEKWEGTLNLNEDTKLRIAFEMDNNSKGKFHSVDQKAFNIEMEQIEATKNTRAFTIKSLQAVFNGKIVDNSLNGQLIIGNSPFEVNFQKCETFSFKISKRPQEEAIGGNYSTEVFTCITPKNGNQLAGVLTLPKNTNNFPTVVFISGSGPNDKDHTIFGHKNFLVLADLLAKVGIASLRLDDRGVGNSTGNFETATVFDLADDVSDAINQLSKDERINPEKIGIIGHSLGAEIAPRVSILNPKVKYIIMLAGSADPLYQCIIDQTEAIYAKQVKSAQSIEVNTKILKAVFKSLQDHKDDNLALQALDKQLDSLRNEIEELPLDDLKIMEIKPTVSAHDFKYFFNDKWRTDLFYQPTEWLSKVTVPVLALNGTLDTQVIPNNLEKIQNTLKKHNHKNFVTKRYEGKNHMFQNAKTGLPSEYAAIEETIATDVVGDIINWINQITK